MLRFCLRLAGFICLLNSFAMTFAAPRNDSVLSETELSWICQIIYEDDDPIWGRRLGSTPVMPNNCSHPILTCYAFSPTQTAALKADGRTHEERMEAGMHHWPAPYAPKSRDRGKIACAQCHKVHSGCSGIQDSTIGPDGTVEPRCDQCKRRGLLCQARPGRRPCRTGSTVVLEVLEPTSFIADSSPDSHAVLKCQPRPLENQEENDEIAQLLHCVQLPPELPIPPELLPYLEQQVMCMQQEPTIPDHTAVETVVCTLETLSDRSSVSCEPDACSPRQSP